MSDLHHDQPRNPLQKIEQQHDESNTMLAILFAGIGSLFIAGIIGAFIYAKDTNPVTAQAPSAQAPSAPAAAAPSSTGPSTTGFATTGSNDRNAPARTRDQDVNQMGDPLSPQAR